MLGRLPNTKNTFISTLDKLITSKKGGRKTKKENLISLRQNNEIIMSMMNSICVQGNVLSKISKGQNARLLSPRPLFNAVGALIVQTEKLNLHRVREIVHNALNTSKDILSHWNPEERIVLQPLEVP